MSREANLDWLIADVRRYRYAPNYVAHDCRLIITARKVRRSNAGRNFTVRCACQAESRNTGRPFTWDSLGHVRDRAEALALFDQHRAEYNSNATILTNHS